MRVKFIVILCFVLFGYSAKSQDIFGIPMNERDSVYIFFLEDDGRYNSYKLGSIDGEKSVRYRVKMQFGIDLCFTTEYAKPESYTSQCSFDDLRDKDIKGYCYLYENYMDEDMEELVKKLKWDSTNFFLVIPDSVNQSAHILDVFNCNNSHD